MKLDQAFKLINERKQKKNEFRVHFEERKGSMLVSDYLPDREEKPFDSEHTAWEFAERFAEVDPAKYVNIYVIDSDFSPVENYRDRILNEYPERQGDDDE